MAKKTPSRSRPKEIKHARIELTLADYAMVQEVANSMGLGVAAYLRMAVLQRARRDKANETELGD